MKGSVLEMLLWEQLGAAHLLIGCEREVTFAKPRRWRFDFAWADKLLAVEVEGGSFVHGRHNRGMGIEADCEKYNSAVLMGWRILRFETHMVEDGRALATIAQSLGASGPLDYRLIADALR